MGFKEDIDFARFVSVGAIGTAVVAAHLRDRFNHRPIELERYAMANKVWQTKVKRLRLPDLVCLRCGLRVESRAKTKLSITLSHSETPGREWDSGGMRENDFFAFLLVDINQEPPHCGTPAFFSRAALKSTVSSTKRSSPKAASAGSEITLTWPSWVPTRGGRLICVDDEDRIVVAGDDGRKKRYWQWRNWDGPRCVYLKPGDFFQADETLIAGVVEPEVNPICPGDNWDLASALVSDDIVERYSAIKAVARLGDRKFAGVLTRLSEDAGEDWRIRLEAEIALGRQPLVVVAV